MSFTSLSLGHNWPADEWPEYVEVDHDDGRGGGPVRYVPERTCRDERKKRPDSFLCSKCGWFWIDFDGDELGFSYCPNCGRKVVEP